MTTIAIGYDSGRLKIAADGMRVSGTERISMNEVKVKKVGWCVYAITGDWALFDAAIAWHQAGAEAGKQPKAEGQGAGWTLVVVDRWLNVGTYRADTPFVEEYPVPQSFGSGSPYAMALLRAGISPRRAVEIASDLDIHTGGTITEIDIAEVLDLDEQKAAAE